MHIRHSLGHHEIFHSNGLVHCVEQGELQNAAVAHRDRIFVLVGAAEAHVVHSFSRISRNMHYAPLHSIHDLADLRAMTREYRNLVKESPPVHISQTSWEFHPRRFRRLTHFVNASQQVLV